MQRAIVLMIGLLIHGAAGFRLKQLSRAAQRPGDKVSSRTRTTRPPASKLEAAHDVPVELCEPDGSPKIAVSSEINGSRLEASELLAEKATSPDVLDAGRESSGLDVLPANNTADQASNESPGASQPSRINPVVRGLITAAACATPERMIRYLFNLPIVQSALVSFLEKSPFLERLVLRAAEGIFTETLCGRRVRMTVAIPGTRRELGSELLVVGVLCDGECQKQLDFLMDVRTYRKSWEHGTIANDLVNISRLVDEARMQRILLQLLAENNRWLQGVDPERLTEVAQPLLLTGIPLPLGGRTVYNRFSIRVSNMKRQTVPAPQTTGDSLPSQCSPLLEAMKGITHDAAESWIAMTLFGAMDAILTNRDLFFCDALPTLLNAVIAPWEITVKLTGALKCLNWVANHAPAKGITFLPNPRDMSVCPQRPSEITARDG